VGKGRGSGNGRKKSHSGGGKRVGGAGKGFRKRESPSLKEASPVIPGDKNEGKE